MTFPQHSAVKKTDRGQQHLAELPQMSDPGKAWTDHEAMCGNVNNTALDWTVNAILLIIKHVQSM